MTMLPHEEEPTNPLPALPEPAEAVGEKRWDMESSVLVVLSAVALLVVGLFYGTQWIARDHLVRSEESAQELAGSDGGYRVAEEVRQAFQTIQALDTTTALSASADLARASGWQPVAPQPAQPQRVAMPVVPPPEVRR